LLGAIVTAFLIETRQDVTADPATISDSPTSYKKFEPTSNYHCLARECVPRLSLPDIYVGLHPRHGHEYSIF
jgi:hypothetical protein